MYDEYERAVTGGRSDGLSFWGWVAIAMGTLFALGIVGVAVASFAIRGKVVEVAEEIRTEVNREVQLRPALAAAEMADRLESHSRLLNTPPEKGASLLLDMDGDAPADAFMEDFFGGSMDFLSGEDGFSLDLKEALSDGFLQIAEGGDAVRMELLRGEDGGSFVINSPDGQFRLDLQKTDDGGFLAIDSEEGEVRFDLVKSDDGGSLIIKSNEGEVRFDAQGSEDGGSLTVLADGEEIRFAAGADAEAVPGWVPRMNGMPSDPQRVYSLSSGEGFFGAVTWEGSEEAKAIVGSFRETLQAEGYELASEHRVSHRGLDRYSLWARDEGAERMVFLVAEEADDGTRILLGYGEGGE